MLPNVSLQDSSSHPFIIISQSTVYMWTSFTSVAYCTMYCISCRLWLWNGNTIPIVCVWLSSPCPPSVIDHSWEKPNQEKVWALQFPSQQCHWHREHPGGPREEVRGQSTADQQGVGSEWRTVWQQMEAKTSKWGNQLLEVTLTSSYWMAVLNKREDYQCLTSFVMPNACRKVYSVGGGCPGYVPVCFS